ncbi:MAG: peptidoglycan-binding protein [Actinomycetota bacterium]|nr:peptidoglycan-binding protein [Actinomycetota bacterium]
MRRRACLVALLLTTALVTAGPASAASPKIAALQLALAKRGFYHGPLDGVVGRHTRQAIKRFQRRHRLQIDGVVGPQTRRKLGRWARHELGHRLLRRGRSGWDIAELQFLLRRYGVRVSIDGIFGPGTRRAVIRAQRAAGLRADGLVGRRTIAALKSRRHRHIARVPVQRDVRTSIVYWSHHYGVDDRLARALAWVESGYQPNLTSSTGAWGVFQIMPGTWRYVETVLAGRRYPRTVTGNVRVGLLFLRQQLRDFRSERRALAAWYTGPGFVRRHGISPAGRWFAANVLAVRARL